MSRERMNVFATSMHGRVTFEPEKGQKSGRDERHVRGSRVHREDLRQDVEESDCYYGSGTEAEQQMKAIAKPKGCHATQSGGDERNRSKNYRHESRAVGHRSDFNIDDQGVGLHGPRVHSAPGEPGRQSHWKSVGQAAFLVL